MVSRIRILICLFTGFILSGCATVPDLPDEERLPLDVVLKNVRCEVTRALGGTAERFEWLRHSAVAFQLTLRVEEKDEGSADTALVFPIHTGTFTIGFTAGLNEKSAAKSELYIGALYNDFDLDECPETEKEKSGASLEGNLGLSAWIERAAAAIESTAISPDQIKRGDKDTYIAHQVEFVVVASGSVSPKFNIVRAGRTRSGLFKLGVSREESNILRIAILPQKVEKFKKVRVVKKVMKPVPGQPGLMREESIIQYEYVPQPGGLDKSTSDGLRSIIQNLKDDRPTDR